jgi:predicted DNA-binding transcriptional regulator AlpA
MTTRVPQAARVAPAKKAAAAKPPTWLNATQKARRAARKAEREHDQHEQNHVHGSRAPPDVKVRLLDRHEVCAICGVTYQIIWRRMRQGSFPRSRIVGGRSMWLSDEVEQWLRNLPVRPLKGDALVESDEKERSLALRKGKWKPSPSDDA